MCYFLYLSGKVANSGFRYRILCTLPFLWSWGFSDADRSFDALRGRTDQLQSALRMGQATAKPASGSLHAILTIGLQIMIPAALAAQPRSDHHATSDAYSFGIQFSGRTGSSKIPILYGSLTACQNRCSTRSSNPESNRNTQ